MAGMWLCPVPDVRVERGCEDAHEHRAFPVEDLPAQGKALHLHRTPGQRYPLARDAEGRGVLAPATGIEPSLPGHFGVSSPVGDDVDLPRVAGATLPWCVVVNAPQRHSIGLAPMEDAPCSRGHAGGLVAPSTRPIFIHASTQGAAPTELPPGAPFHPHALRVRRQGWAPTGMESDAPMMLYPVLHPPRGHGGSSRMTGVVAGLYQAGPRTEILLDDIIFVIFGLYMGMEKVLNPARLNEDR